MNRIEVTRIWLVLVVSLSTLIPIAAIVIAALIHHQGSFEGFIGGIGSLIGVLLLFLTLWFRVAFINISGTYQKFILSGALAFLALTYVSLSSSIS